MQAVAVRGRFRLGDAVAWIYGLHPLRRQCVAIGIAILHHIDIVGLLQSQMRGVVLSLSLDADVDPHHAVL